MRTRSTSRKRYTPLLAVLFALAMLAAACSSDEGETAAEGCDPLPTKTEGVLTVATGEPAYPPWMGVGDDNFDNLEAGTGYEGALVYALAEEMGLTVEWLRTGFDEAIAPGSKDWDFNIQQYTITEDREKVVDFSDGYYAVDMALVAYPDNVAASASSLGDLKGLRIGAAIGTTALTYVDDVIKPDTAAPVYDDNAALLAAFDAGQLDGIVLDLPTAYYNTAVAIPDAVIVGVLPPAGDQDQLGMLFEDGSPFVACVNEALEALRSKGSLDEFQQEYLQAGGSIPTLDK
ncbi:MAG: transporter substrate-binding domain-containing protein [Actinomycetota bacterium]